LISLALGQSGDLVIAGGEEEVERRVLFQDPTGLGVEALRGFHVLSGKLQVSVCVVQAAGSRVSKRRRQSMRKVLTEP